MLGAGLSQLVDRYPGAPSDGYHVNLETLAAWLGVGGSTGQNSPLVRSLRRLVRFYGASAKALAAMPLM